MSVLQRIQIDPTDWTSVVTEIRIDPTAFHVVLSPSRPGSGSRYPIGPLGETGNRADRWYTNHTIPVSPLTQTRRAKSQDLEVAKRINSILFCAISFLSHHKLNHLFDLLSWFY